MADADPTETTEQKVTRLEQELAARSQELTTKDAELRGYKTTLDALKPPEGSSPVVASGEPPLADATTGLPPALVSALRSRGYKDEDIVYNMRVLNDFLPIAAQPFVQALAAIGDTADLGNFLAEEGAGKDTLTIKEEVEKLRKSDAQAGRPVRSRKDYAIAVKARRAIDANSPDAIDKIVEERVQERLRQASGQGATVRGAGASTQGAGPGPTGGRVTSGSKSYTREEFDRLPLAEKRSFLESLGDDAAA